MKVKRNSRNVRNRSVNRAFTVASAVSRACIFEMVSSKRCTLVCSMALSGSSGEVDKVAAEALVAKLKAGDWINLNTRAFIVEFTAYNANTGLFTVGQIMVEMSRTGVYLPSFQFRNFPRVSYSFTNTSDIARLVLEVIFLVYFYAKYLRDECKQMGERWEDPVKEGSVHWKAGDEKEQGIRKQLAEKLKDARPTLGSILVGNLDFKSERAQRIVDCIRNVGDCVVIRPYFYESFNYFDIGLILCFTSAVVVQVVQLVEEMTALPKICAGNAFVPGSFIISHMHSARMYLIAFGSFFCWCKVKAASHMGTSRCRCRAIVVTCERELCDTRDEKKLRPRPIRTRIH